MIIVKELSDNQDLGAVAVGVEDSTNTLDLGVADRNIGEGTQILLYCSVGDEAFTSGGAALVQLKFEHSADDATYVELLTIEPIAVATLIAGYQVFRGAMPEKTLRYVKATYTVSAFALTA